MKNIYQESIAAVEQGVKFKVDFQKKLLKIGDKTIIDNGKYEGNLGIELVSDITEFIANIENLYDPYKHSMPSERSENQRKRYFIALPEKELDDDDMLYGVGRDVAQITLELYILSQILLGFQWNEAIMGKWFWQSKVDKDLVILRKWFNN